MGCCASAPEQPRKKSNSMSYTNQGGGGVPVGGANSYQHKPMNAGGYPPSAAYPSSAAPRGPPGYNMGGPPQMGGPSMVPQVGAAVPHIGGAGTMGGGRSALMFIGLYRYEARTPEDLSFDKGQSLLW